MRYTPWIVSEHVPDFSSLEALVRDPRFAGKAGEELAVALWQLMVDRDLGIYHYFPAGEMLWGKDLFDPVATFNSFGFSICHCHANILVMLLRAAGLPARIANITGHEGSEAYYDGSWHYLDADLAMFYRRRPADGGGGDPNRGVSRLGAPIASREELYRDPSLVVDQPAPSYPHHIPDRLPQNIQKLYTSVPSYPDLMEERVHSMAYRLRPGEEMTRHFHNRGRWVVYPDYPDCFGRYPGETGPEGPTERFWPRRQWGNGYFLYQPRLSSAFRDVELGADAVEHLELRDDGLHCPGASGQVVFAFESPYVYCGIPDPMRRVPPVDGATLAAKFDVPAGGAARVEIARERGEQWLTVWSAPGTGKTLEPKIDFTELVEAGYRFRLRIVLEGAGAVLRSMQTRLWFMVSPQSLPALKVAGDNRMRLHSGDKHGLNTRPIMVERRTDHNRGLAAFAASNLRVDPQSGARLHPIDPDRPWEVVYELDAGEGGRMAWLHAYTIIEGRKPAEPPEPIPARIEIADSPAGPWAIIAQRDILEHEQGWHFGVFGEGRFSGASRRGYVRFSARKGSLGFRIMGHYIPPGADAAAPPLQVEHAWYEDDGRVGLRLKTHAQSLTGTEGEYVVHCDHQPHDERITLRLASLPARP